MPTTLRRAALIFSVALTALLSACSTIKTRIEERQAIFDGLPAEDQAKIRQGVVDLGFTPDMVYIALGQPDLRRDKATAGNTETVWIYNTYYQEYRGTATTGYRRWVYFDPRVKAYRVYYEPVRTDIYQEREEEKIRIVFTDGKVSAIEQAKDT